MGAFLLVTDHLLCVLTGHPQPPAPGPIKERMLSPGVPLTCPEWQPVATVPHGSQVRRSKGRAEEERKVVCMPGELKGHQLQLSVLVSDNQDTG